MSKRMRTVMLAMVVTCLCLALVVGATYALFSDQVTINNHLKAGKLKVGLERVSYTTCVLDGDGTLVTSTDEETVDLLENGDALFQLDKIVPGCWLQADIKVSNNGDVAFEYGVRILWNEDENAQEPEKTLASQIQITVTQGDTPKAQFMLDDVKDVALGALLANAEAQTFTVKAEFVDDNANNDAQDAELDFDLQVYAVQKTE